jgi:hypothetical protein
MHSMAIVDAFYVCVQGTATSLSGPRGWSLGYLPYKASKPWLVIEPNSVQHSSAILRFDSVNKLGSKQGFLTPVRDNCQ